MLADKEENAVAMQTLYQLPDSLWEQVCTIIEPRARRRKWPLRVILSGIIYLLDSGCKWRQLPPQYGSYKLVWYYFNQWAVCGTLDQLLYVLGRELRRKCGRHPEPSLVIIDAQAVRSAAGTSQESGYDGGKKVKGRKRHLAVDTQGTAMAAGVTSAKLHDKPGGGLTLKRDVEDIGRIEKIIADASYEGPPAFTANGRIRWKIMERKEKGKFSVLPIRWVVERTFAWIMNYRRMARDYEKTVTMARAMLLMTLIHITLKKLAT